MSKDELKQYLTNNLVLDVETERGCYSGKDYTIIKLYLEGELITYCSLD
jgi:hypothetical protein